MRKQNINPGLQPLIKSNLFHSNSNNDSTQTISKIAFSRRHSASPTATATESRRRHQQHRIISNLEAEALELKERTSTLQMSLLRAAKDEVKQKRDDEKKKRRRQLEIQMEAAEVGAIDILLLLLLLLPPPPPSSSTLTIFII